MSYDGAYYYLAYRVDGTCSDLDKLIFISHKKYELEGFIERYTSIYELKGYRWSRYGTSPANESLIYSNGRWAAKGGVLDE